MKHFDNYNITPGGNQSLVSTTGATSLSDSGAAGLRCYNQRKSESSGQLKIKTKTFFGTFNINTLLRPGKLFELGNALKEQQIQILALQETRMPDENTLDFGNYRLFKSKTNKRILKNTPHLGVGFAVSNVILNSITDVKPINERLMTISLKSANKMYTLINAHMPINQENKTNPEKVNKSWDTLENTISKIPQNHVKILMGDFNAQLGKERKFRKTIGNFPAHKWTNQNGQRLVELCKTFNLKIMSTHFKKAPSKQKTWRSPNSYLGEFQIDHVAISYPNQKEILNVQVRKGFNIDSDHYLTRIKLKLKPQKQFRKSPQIPKFDTNKITPNFTTELDKKKSTNWPELKDKVIKTAQNLIPSNKRQKHPWWNEECEVAVKLRHEAFKNWSSNKTEERHNTFLIVRKETSKLIRQTKRTYENNQLLELEKDFQKNNTRNFYKTFKTKLTGYQPQSLCFKKENGSLALNNKDNCKELAKYFENLLNCPQPTNKFPQLRTNITNPNSLAPDETEISRQIKRLKNNKASGEDGIVAEHLKAAGPNTIKEITQILQQIWQNEMIPDDWKSALIHPLHKKGDRTDVNNYRGISLLPVTYKIFSQCLLDRAQQQLEPKIGEYQAGFRPNRSCPEQILNLKLILRHQKIYNKNVVCTFVDFKKAYDSIDRESLFQILKEQGLDLKTLALIKETLTNTKSKVKFMGELSEPFEIKTGVRQGDGLSPLLFNCVLEKVIQEWRMQKVEQKVDQPIKLGRTNVKVDCLAFADDLAILTRDTATAQKQIEILKEIAEKVGLQISFEKTEYMANLKHAPKFLNTKYGKIKRVHQFKYLGEIIQESGLEKIANEARCQKMTTAFRLTQNIYNKKSISKHAKLRHYNTVIKPECLYAAETLVLNRKTDLDKIQKRERKIVRKILGPITIDRQTYRLRSNKEVEQYTDLHSDIKKRRLKFFGHIKRMDPSRLTRQIVEFYENRSKAKVETIKWIAAVKEDLKSAGITQTDIQDRKTFRQKIFDWKVGQRENTRRPGAAWSDERKRNHSERMKQVWAQRKANLSRQR